MYTLVVDWGDEQISTEFPSIDGAATYGHRQWHFGADCKITMPDGTVRPLTDFLDSCLLQARRYDTPHRSAYKNMLADKADWFYNLTMFR